MKIHPLLSLVASLSLVSTPVALAGSAPYRAPQAPAAPAPAAQPAEQAYSYHCWARTQDGTEYATAVLAEPTPHDMGFIAKAKEAWRKHLAEKLGMSKFNARCGEAPTSSAATWAADSPQTKRVDWQYR